MTVSLRAAGWLLAACMTFVAGCASPPRATAPDPAATSWSGRLALQVEDRPGDSFSAGFELKGNAQAGELTLLSPLGGVVAVLSWQPGQALLLSGGQTRQFESVDALVAHAAGAAIPVAALFDWLRGVDTAVPGWRTDLSQLPEGRVAARRLDPQPTAQLRIVIER